MWGSCWLPQLCVFILLLICSFTERAPLQYVQCMPCVKGVLRATFRLIHFRSCQMGRLSPACSAALHVGTVLHCHRHCIVAQGAVTVRYFQSNCSLVTWRQWHPVQTQCKAKCSRWHCVSVRPIATTALDSFIPQCFVNWCSQTGADVRLLEMRKEVECGWWLGGVVSSCRGVDLQERVVVWTLQLPNGACQRTQ